MLELEFGSTEGSFIQDLFSPAESPTKAGWASDMALLDPPSPPDSAIISPELALQFSEHVRPPYLY